MKNQLKKVIGIVFAFVLSMSMFGCSTPQVKAVDNASDNSVATSSQMSETQNENAASPSASGNYVATSWSAELAPNGYLVDGSAIVGYDVAPGEYVYTGLDNLGRTQTAYACITVEDYIREQGEDREDFKGDADKISGWGYNQKSSITFPNGKTYNGYFYNRSHLIADSLGGTPNRENLVTGTRFQNVGSDNNGGMAYAETAARDWLSKAPRDAYIYYAVTPVYVGDELVPRSVFVDMLSSDGSLNQHIEVFNVAGDDNYGVDYMTGKIL